MTSALTLIGERIIPNEPDLHAEAKRLADVLKRGDCLRLEGTLGMGKTSFVRALIQHLSAEPVEVTSPTFTISQSYPIQLHGSAAECWHVDLYRIESEHALEELGLHELASRGILCVEWPGIADGWLPADALQIHLTEGDTPTSRRLTYSAATSSDWAARLPG